ncbi:MAG TPA: GNAT family N-acetyltransferase, partial [Acidimicrobiia bacterium]
MNDMNPSATHPNDADIMRVDDIELTVRPITIGDVERLASLFTRLSPSSVHFRFFSPIPRPPRAALLRLADVDHCRRDALVALDGDEIVAVARYDARPGAGPETSRQAEIAITVEDAWQHRGVGRGLARRLAALAADRGYDTFVATMLPDNRA